MVSGSIVFTADPTPALYVKPLHTSAQAWVIGGIAPITLTPVGKRCAYRRSNDVTKHMPSPTWTHTNVSDPPLALW